MTSLVFVANQNTRTAGYLPPRMMSSTRPGLRSRPSPVFRTTHAPSACHSVTSTSDLHQADGVFRPGQHVRQRLPNEQPRRDASGDAPGKFILPPLRRILGVGPAIESAFVVGIQIGHPTG